MYVMYIYIYKNTNHTPFLRLQGTHSKAMLGHLTFTLQVQQQNPALPSPLKKTSEDAMCIYIYGCFLKWWYPQIIHFNRVFHINHPFWGTPILGNPHICISYIYVYISIYFYKAIHTLFSIQTWRYINIIYIYVIVYINICIYTCNYSVLPFEIIPGWEGKVEKNRAKAFMLWYVLIKT